MARVLGSRRTQAWQECQEAKKIVDHNKVGVKIKLFLKVAVNQLELFPAVKWPGKGLV